MAQEGIPIVFHETDCFTDSLTQFYCLTVLSLESCLRKTFLHKSTRTLLETWYSFVSFPVSLISLERPDSLRQLNIYLICFCVFQSSVTKNNSKRKLTTKRRVVKRVSWETSKKTSKKTSEETSQQKSDQHNNDKDKTSQDLPFLVSINFLSAKESLFYRLKSL